MDKEEKLGSNLDSNLCEGEIRTKTGPKKLTLIISLIIAFLIIITVILVVILLNKDNKETTPVDEPDESQLQNETYKTFRNVSENLYIMDIKHNYFLDEFESSYQLNGIQSFLSSLIKLYNISLSNDIENFKPNFTFACSAFNAFNSKNINLLGRNFDFLDSPTMVVWSHPKNKLKSISFVSLSLIQYIIQLMPQGLDLNKLLVLLTPYLPMDEWKRIINGNIRIRNKWNTSNRWK